MASPSFFCSSTSNPLQSPPPPHHSPLFTPIPELEVEEEEGMIKASATAAEDTFPYKHQPTPLHLQPEKAAATTPTRGSFSVLCNKCRPSSRDKNSVVPVDSSSLKSPSSKFHSLLSSLTRGRSPKPAPNPTPSSAPSAPEAAASDDTTYWKTATVELSRKLIGATRKRDEALLEASRLKHSVSDLERKLAKLESYCLHLRTSLDSQLTSPTIPFPTDSFLAGVSSARAAVRALARSSRGDSPLAHVEASLSRVFYDDFERCCNELGGSSSVLDPAGRCEASRAAYEAVRGITWEGVLSKGTKHYSEGLSRFCDRKMSEVVAALGWARAWPESLLQAFFAAAKGVWMVRLLARCAHPAVPVMRVGGGAAFDAAYMEDVVVGEKVRRLTPVSVKMMVSPGFYVYSASGGGVGVVKCKVLCAYSNSVESQN
ncbi:putative IRK-interacting protein [Iris pallida]|uniref:IRK-interacting protein n=1 Tax=Iris pallida TaxID=29817 RepID=A0AAX6F8I8_IRIPA|nr:putative IRK-interacting protein [Iris pallida]